jgi:N-methylhydantoinase B
VRGGSAAQPGRFTIRRAGAQQPASIDKENALLLAAGDVVCVETGGGGGYGPPSGRQLQHIQRDLDAGYVSAAAAGRDYGVTVGDDGEAHR